MNAKYTMGLLFFLIFILGFILGANKLGTGLFIAAKYGDMELNIIGDKLKFFEHLLSEKNQAYLMSSMIKGLDVNHPLSEELRKLSKNTEGPWSAVERNVSVFIVDDHVRLDSSRAVDYAVTCASSAFSHQYILMYGRGKDSVTSRAHSVVVLQDQYKSGLCQKDNESIWISKKTAKKWLNLDDVPDNVNVYAKIISPEFLANQQ